MTITIPDRLKSLAFRLLGHPNIIEDLAAANQEHEQLLTELRWAQIHARHNDERAEKATVLLRRARRTLNLRHSTTTVRTQIDHVLDLLEAGQQ